MSFKSSKRGSIVVVVSIMVTIIVIMVIILIYSNNKEEDKLKQIEIQKKTEIDIVRKNDKSSNINNIAQEEYNSGSMDKVLEIKYQYFSDLINITNGKEINGVIFEETLSGSAKVSYLNNSYLMVASFENLPDLGDGNFYEGWLIKEEDPLDVVSTGKAVKVNGVYMNAYTSEKDMTDYDLYTLTIEKDDGDENPSSYHVLEGKIKLLDE